MIDDLTRTTTTTQVCCCTCGKPHTIPPRHSSQLPVVPDGWITVTRIEWILNEATGAYGMQLTVRYFHSEACREKWERKA